MSTIQFTAPSLLPTACREYVYIIKFICVNLMFQVRKQRPTGLEVDQLGKSHLPLKFGECSTHRRCAAFSS